MTLKEMKPGVRYRVVDCAPRGTFQGRGYCLER